MNITTRRDRGEIEIGDNLVMLIGLVVFIVGIVAITIWGD